MNKVKSRNIDFMNLAKAGLLLMIVVTGPAWSESGTATVKVVVEPSTSGYVNFTGMPNGQVTVPEGSITASGLDNGSYTTTISEIAPSLLSAGYALTDVTCDDDTQSPSIVDLASRSATFQLDSGESVLCTFKLTLADNENGGGDSDDGNGDEDNGDGDSDDGNGDNNPVCVCPHQGTWQVSNLTGSMTCTGVVSMNMPLEASNETGEIVVSNACNTLTASGMSEDEETIVFERTSDCGYKGSVGGEYEGIPMKIDFSLMASDKSNMSGSLHSVVNQSGMSCTMKRDYKLQFAN